MNNKEKYIIQCREMRQVDTFIVDDMLDLMRILQRYMTQFGPIDLLYRVVE